ncbi:hypothetical protein KAH81_00675 [bacterium]|nr:hypothetical protein [bacterium]
MALIAITSTTIWSSSISAKGNALLCEIPLGRDSLYETNIVGINTSGDSTPFVFSVAPNNEKFYEPLQNIGWLIAVPETLWAKPNGQTQPLKILTKFPGNPLLTNRHFSASIIVRQASKGTISLGVALKVRLETVASRLVPENLNRLALIPSKISYNGDIDSLYIFNGTKLVDTVEVYWTDHLGRKRNSEKVFLFRRILLWELPLHTIFLEPKCGEWIFFKKNISEIDSHGYIVCNGRENYIYSRIGE